MLSQGAMLEGNCRHEGVHLPSSGGARLGKEGFRLVEDCCSADPEQGTGEVEAAPCRDGKVDFLGGGYREP